MPDTSVKDQIKKLIEVQKIDSEIYELKTQLEEKPAVVEQLKQEFEATKSHLHDLEAKLQGIQVKRKEVEVDLQGKEDGITKANAQLSEIKNNKEYTAKIHEIENMKADKSVLEEKILKSYDEADVVTAEIEKEKAKVAEEEKKYLAKKSEVDAEVSKINVRVDELKASREQLVPEIDQAVLPKYNQLVERLQGLAVAPVVGGNSCGGCYMNVMPQTVNAIKLGDDYVQCERCSRILYLEEEV